MIQRSLGKCGLSASIIGLGCEHFVGLPLSAIQRVVDAAIAGGMNIFDVFMPDPEVRDDIGAALDGRRGRVILQGHIGAGWKDAQYFKTRDLSECQFFFEDFMRRYRTDYVDIGMIHFIDTKEDAEAARQNGLIEYALELKRKGVIRAVGLSSHDTKTALSLVQTGAIDVLMFSINPAFDVLPPEQDLDSLFLPETYEKREKFIVSPERMELYQTCEKLGVGITVMKGLGAGILLDKSRSPFGAALTPAQCIHYGLTRPGVSSVLVGCRTETEVEQALLYLEAADKEKDYATVIAGAEKFSVTGRCVYCNHCLPCPAEIDIAAVNKYLDLFELSSGAPETVRAHYAGLEKNASDCIACGQCEERCPFAVKVIERMERARETFG